MAQFRLFLVEDRESDISLLKAAVEKCAPEVPVLTFSTGAKLLDALKSDPNPPGLILLDINLPGASGIEVLRQLRETPAYRLYPTAILSTSNSPADIRQCLEQSCCGYFVKPVEVKVFFEMMDALLRYWRFAWSSSHNGR